MTWERERQQGRQVWSEKVEQERGTEEGDEG